MNGIVLLRNSPDSYLTNSRSARMKRLIARQIMGNHFGGTTKSNFRLKFFHFVNVQSENRTRKRQTKSYKIRQHNFSLIEYNQ